ncbi:hypothetical protein [Hymenobacter negativus]|uniref:T9SS type A sorting domain-containing protein n=1 Tax=Hymenobacter negativus TaxID=2795026 RepID=A0ABS3QAL2_9BACT|nr:hypothetical protein [Hymenobacter negativus]MBO2008236.1 hypothetical protein [Hymenobacter negativus]
MPLWLSAQSWQSVVALPTAVGGSSAIVDLAPDGIGGYVVTGDFTGTITLGTTTLSSAGSQDIFVARFDAANQCTQAVRAGGLGYDRAAALALDAIGAVTVAGDFDGPTATFGATVLTNAASTNNPYSSDVFVATLSTAGQWTRATGAGGPSIDIAEDVALDANGTAVVVGSFVGGTATFGSFTVSSRAISGALFVARLSSAGSWSAAMSATSNGSPSTLTGVALDANGNAVVCGYLYTGGTLALGTTTVTNYTASTTVFVARLSRTNAWTQATQAINSGGYAFSGPVAVDASGNVVVAGVFSDNDIRFGTTTLTYQGMTGPARNSDNLFVARLSSGGVWTYAAQASGINGSSPTAIAFDQGGNVLVAGYFYSSSLTLGNTALANANPNPSLTAANGDVFLARLNPAGSWTYAIQAGGLGADGANALALDGNGALIAGSFGNSPASFGLFTVTTPAAYTGFVARIGGAPLASAAIAGLSQVAMAPNPAARVTTLALPAASETTTTTLLDALGRIARTYALPAHATSATLDLAGLAPGLYVVRCGAAAGKLVVE